MKKITAETTRYMMDAMTFAFVAATVAATGEEPTDQEIDSHVRALMALYCRTEGIEATYDGIVSTAFCPGCCAYCDEYDEDEDDYEDEDEEDEDWDDGDEDYDDEDEDEDEDEENEEDEDDEDGLTLADILEALVDYLADGD